MFVIARINLILIRCTCLINTWTWLCQ